MTSNQLAYWRNVETERTNRAQEAEKERANRASEGLKAQEVMETQRTNLANEAIKSRQTQAQEDETTLKYFFKAIEPLTGLAGSFARGMIGGN